MAVEETTSGQLGLETFYPYTGTPTGAGSSVVNNAASGNAVFSYNAFANPGRGLNTFFRISYMAAHPSPPNVGQGPENGGSGVR
ncbi:hypothetical protein [Streptomyces sp. MAR4 CNX-425]|uniref:hypothetical protein n=1 Tax=Streptomyces sp. MAR4 CNX-425 TaxID=3406343 RepID=UPI003B50CA1A